jgi:ADP-heptose:LPS heptosyltransferase
VEGERLARLAASLSSDRFRIAQSLPLSQLALLLRQCSGYIGHDSGISHLAAALGLRGLVLWGETREEIWRPRGDHVRLISSPFGLTELDVDEVLAVVREHLA